MLCLPLARTLHQASGLNFHFHDNQPTQSPRTTFSFTSKVLLLHCCSCHLQANVLQAGRTLCTSQLSHAYIPTQAISHTCQHCAMQNCSNKWNDTSTQHAIAICINQPMQLPHAYLPRLPQWCSSDNLNWNCSRCSAKSNYSSQYDSHMHQNLLRIDNLRMLWYLMMSVKRPRYCR